LLQGFRAVTRWFLSSKRHKSTNGFSLVAGLPGRHQVVPLSGQCAPPRRKTTTRHGPRRDRPGSQRILLWTIVQNKTARAKERQKAAGGDKTEGALMDNCPGALSTARDEAGATFGVSGKNVDRASHGGTADIGRVRGSAVEALSLVYLGNFPR